ncbi:MAG: hypothetical protein MUC29_08955 [Pyrinomonadaceae bacterium]|nr:hypothetical protein [Pyrinomonadaceae bacterium]
MQQTAAPQLCMSGSSVSRSWLKACFCTANTSHSVHSDTDPTARSNSDAASAHRSHIAYEKVPDK